MLTVHKLFIKLLCGLVILLWMLPGKGQSSFNLVPNPSFEQYSVCPSASISDKPDIWYKPDLNGAGYLNACSPSNLSGVPIHYTTAGSGFQYAKSGIAYALMFYFNSSAHNYLQIQLTDSLKVGNCYYGECYVNLSNPFKVACNNQAMLLTKQAVVPSNGILLANPQIENYSNQIIKDTLNWVRISSVFVAHGGEQYLTLGNFRYDNQTNYQVVNPTGGYFGAAYYIDDVSIYALDSLPLKADAGLDTTIALGDSTFIGSLTNGIPNITWYDTGGNVIDTGRPGFYVQPTTTTTYIIAQTVCGYYSRDTVTVTVNLLPLHWLEFTAESSSSLSFGEGRGEVTLLRWQTANEVNLSNYNIQRSLPGKAFTNIAQVPANNKPYNEYSYVDDKAFASPLSPLRRIGEGPGVRFYRIQSIDKDGMRSYSTIKQVTLNSKLQTLSIYPNPAKAIVNIEYAAMKEISIADVAGRVVLQQHLYGVHFTQINIGDLPKGVFFVKIIGADNKAIAQKLVVE